MNRSYQLIIIILILGALFSGCHNQLDDGNSNEIPYEDVLNTIFKYVSRPTVPRDWSNKFSPDGNLYILNEYYSPNTSSPIIGFHGFFISDPKLSFETPSLFDLESKDISDAEHNYQSAVGDYKRFDRWSPDSSMFTVLAQDQPRSGCSWHQLVVYQYTGERLLDEHIIDIPFSGECVQ